MSNEIRIDPVDIIYTIPDKILDFDNVQPEEILIKFINNIRLDNNRYKEDYPCSNKG